MEHIAQVYDCSGVNNGVLPDDYKTLCATVGAYLGVATAARPLCVFIDSLDQLDNADGGREELQWLPDTLPPHVCVVVSTLPHVGGCWSALQRKGIVGACPLPPSDVGGAPKSPNVVTVTPLADGECMDIVTAWLARDRRALTPPQMAVLTEAVAKCPLPLYVKLAYDRTKRWKSFHEPEVCVCVCHSECVCARMCVCACVLVCA